METFCAEDFLCDNLSCKLSKGPSYINERRSVSFFPFGSNVYTPSSGNRVLKIAVRPSISDGFSRLKTRMLQTIDARDLCLLLIPSLEEHD